MQTYKNKGHCGKTPTGQITLIFFTMVIHRGDV